MWVELLLSLTLGSAPTSLQQDTLPRAKQQSAVRYSRSRSEATPSFREQLEQLRIADYLSWSKLPTLAPISGATVTSPYGRERLHPVTGDVRPHYGTDIRARQGTVIRAAGSGVVVGAMRTPSYGWAVDIDHGNGFVSRYAHASRLLVRKGDAVRRGQTIAYSGSTGRAKGPHLHYEIFREGWSVDPHDYMVYEADS